MRVHGRKAARIITASMTPAKSEIQPLCTLQHNQPVSGVSSVRQENHGNEERAHHITPESVDDWLRHAQRRATNLYYLAEDPSPALRERALLEMVQALREALEEVRAVADELRREAATREGPREQPRRGGNEDTAGERSHG